MKKNTFIILSLLVIELFSASAYAMNGSSSSNGFSANDLKKLRRFLAAKQETVQDLYSQNRLNANAAAKFITFAGKPGMPTALRFVEDCILTAGDQNSVLSQPAGLLLSVLNCSTIGRGVTQALQESLGKGGRLSQTVNTVAHPQGIAASFLQSNAVPIDTLLNYIAPRFIVYAPVMVHMLNAGENFLREQETKNTYPVVRADSAGIKEGMSYWCGNDIDEENRNNSLILAARFDGMLDDELLKLEKLQAVSVRTTDIVADIDTAVSTALDALKSGLSDQKKYGSKLQIDDEEYDGIIFDWAGENKKK